MARRKQPLDPNKLIDDSKIVGGSPMDRVIGMLLERTEAIRELHESMREEFRGLIDTHADIKSMMARVIERQENHERTDTVAFTTITNNNAAIIAKIDNLGAQITAATTASVIQKAQFNIGWKIIVVIGGIVAALWGVFATLFNHKWT